MAPWLHVNGKGGRMAPLPHITPVTNKRGRCRGRSVALLRTVLQSQSYSLLAGFGLCRLTLLAVQFLSSLCGRVEGPTDIETAVEMGSRPTTAKNQAQYGFLVYTSTLPWPQLGRKR